MKKFVVLISFIFTVMNGFGQTGPKDLILLLDTSASMSASYQEVNSYISGALLKEHLSIGDTFHLIPFSRTAYLDISRRIEGRGELETIIGRMFLQYPLDSWSDIPAALSFAENYASSLPARPKKIVLVSDGITVLPPDSTSAPMDASAFDRFIADNTARLRRNNINLEFIKVVPGQAMPKAATASASGEQTPSRQATQSGVQAASPGQATQSGAQAATPEQATQSGAQTGTSGQATQSGAQAAAPGQATQSGAQAAAPDQATQSGVQTGTSGQTTQSGAQTAVPGQTTPSGTALSSSAGAAAEPPATQQPDEKTNQEVQKPAEPVASTGGETPQTKPQKNPESEKPNAASRSNGPPVGLLILLAAIGLIILILIIFFIIRRLHGRPNKVMAQAVSPAKGEAPFTDHSKDLASYAASQSKQRVTPYADRRPAAPVTEPEDPSGPMMLNLFVEDQNTLIGKRNIHSIKPGVSFSVGGGNSDYLIFLVPVPTGLGTIRRDENRYTFIPKKPQYFPDIGSQQVTDCIGKTIRIISDKHYEVRFRFERYEDPLKALNKLLNSVMIPG
jgi:hypothetical protein